MKGFRKERFGEVLLSFLASELRLLADPHLHAVTLTDIDVTPDLKTAWVYWSSYIGAEEGSRFPTEEERTAIQASLQKVAKFLRKRTGEELEVRYVPEVVFKFDESLERGTKIDQLLSKIQTRS